MKKLIAIILLIFVFALPVRADMNPEFEPVEIGITGGGGDTGYSYWKWILAALAVIGGGILIAGQQGGDNTPATGTVIVR